MTRTRTLTSPFDLTPAEEAVLKLVAEGLETEEIALRRQCRGSTIYMQIKSICQKMGAHSRDGAVRVAREKKLL